MNKNINSNIKISLIYGLSILRKHINKVITDLSVENIKNKYTEIGLENKKSVNSKKTNKNLQTIIKLSYKITNTNQSQLNLLNKNQSNLILSKLNSLNNFNKGLTKTNLNESNLILMNEQQYIRLISPFNYKLANITNDIYTFTNKSYKQINKNLPNLYTICKLAFLNLSSIISKNINKGFNNRFSNNKIPSFLSGIYLKLAGKVLTQRSPKRVKSKVIQLGSLARTKARIINTNRFVNKNKRGTFSLTIQTGHIIND